MENKITITKLNKMGNSEFTQLTKDPTNLVRLMTQRLIIDTTESITELFDEMDAGINEIYYTEEWSATRGVIYFWSFTDFSNFRR